MRDPLLFTVLVCAVSGVLSATSPPLQATTIINADLATLVQTADVIVVRRAPEVGFGFRVNVTETLKGPNCDGWPPMDRRRPFMRLAAKAIRPTSRRYWKNSGNMTGHRLSR